MSPVLRPATAEDIDTLFQIRTSVVQNHLSREQLTDMGITRDALAAAMAEHPCAWIAEIAGVPAGFAMVDAEGGELFALFVRPEYEGQGVGRLLLATAEHSLFCQHPRIHLVTDGNAGIRANGFYQRQGWTRVAVLDERDVRYEKVRPGAAD